MRGEGGGGLGWGLEKGRENVSDVVGGCGGEKRFGVMVEEWVVKKWGRVGMLWRVGGGEGGVGGNVIDGLGK